MYEKRDRGYGNGNHDDVTQSTTTIKTTGRTDGARDADSSRALGIFFISFLFVLMTIL